jgi:hypothetical protein
MQDGSTDSARITDRDAPGNNSLRNDSMRGDDAPLSLSTALHSAASSHKLSRDEMNLAEFPLTVLSKRADPSVKTLEFSDYVKGKNGDVINRQWIITGADKFGLPTSSDDEVLLGLLKLTADDGVQSRKVHFTRYELLRILRWTTEGRSYTRLQNALDRLSGVRIKATNAFYDNETKLHSTRNFGIIDAYEINDGRDTRPSFFTWSEVLFKSFQVGFIKKLDLDFYLDLQSAVSKRLYRYLDKHFWYRSRIQVNLFTLAHEKIGVSRNYVYASSLRQQLEPALEELKEKGILSDYEFSGKGKATEVTLVAAYAPKKTLQAPTESATNTATNHQNSARQTDGFHTAGAERPPHVSESVRTVQEALVQRGLAEKQAFRLTAGQGRDSLDRMQLIIAHYDALLAAKSPLISKSPTGFLFRAMERPFDFVLPGEKRIKQSELYTGNSHDPGKSSQQREEDQKSVQPTKKCLEVEYLTVRRDILKDVLGRTAADVHERVRGEVEQALSKLRAHISPQRFAEAVQHGVEQRLLDSHGFPEFEVWVQSRL